MQQLLNGVILGCSYALIASGLTIIFGVMDVLNLAHGEIYMLGAYFTFYLCTGFGLDYVLSLTLSILAIMGLAVLLEKGLFSRTRGLMSATLIVSLGLSMVLQNVALLVWGPGPRGIPTPYTYLTINVGAVSLTAQRLLVLIISLALMCAMHLFIQRTKTGRAIRATAQNREAAATLGINFALVYTATFAMGCGLAAAAGSLLGPIYYVSATMGFRPLLKSFAAVILGGMGSIRGAISGALVLGMAEVIAIGYLTPKYGDAIAFLVIILVLSIKPTGLFGEKTR